MMRRFLASPERFTGLNDIHDSDPTLRTGPSGCCAVRRIAIKIFIVRTTTVLFSTMIIQTNFTVLMGAFVIRIIKRMRRPPERPSCRLLSVIAFCGICSILHWSHVTAFSIERHHAKIVATGRTKLFVSSRRKTTTTTTNTLTNPEIRRYSRHLVLSDVGMAGQQALKDASVLVVGAGGLGSPCLLYLAAAGVGHVGIVDADTVDESNLQRQIIHGTSTVGKSKCQSAKERIVDINPNVNVRLYEEEFTSETAMRILGDGFDDNRPYDVVVDGSDNFPTKYLINDACDIIGIPWVYSAILAFEGQLSVFNFPVGIGPTYRDLLPTPPPPGDVPSCAEGGVLGVLPGTMGCLQATEVIKLILNRRPDELTTGRVLVFDAMAMKFNQVGLEKVKPEDGREVITELIDYQGFCAGPKSTASGTTTTQTPTLQLAPDHSIKNGRTMDEAEEEAAALVLLQSSSSSFHSLTPHECLDKLSSGWTPWVLDVRLHTENDIVALPFTDRVAPHRTVKLEHIPITGDVLVYCKAGVRGKKACTRLIELGVDSNRLYNLDGGIMKWQADIDPSMPRY
jgi:sulfur-carrier protein adenylyltransferase/sulfurtransferase